MSGEGATPLMYGLGAPDTDLRRRGSACIAFCEGVSTAEIESLTRHGLSLSEIRNDLAALLDQSEKNREEHDAVVRRLAMRGAKSRGGRW